MSSWSKSLENPEVERRWEIVNSICALAEDNVVYSGAIWPLLEVLEKGDEISQSFAFLAIEAMIRNEIVLEEMYYEALSRKLLSPNPLVREGAMCALATLACRGISKKELLEKLIPLISDEVYWVKASAASMIAALASKSIFSPAALKLLMGLLSWPQPPDTVVEAANALRVLAEAGLLDPHSILLLEKLKNSSRPARVWDSEIGEERETTIGREVRRALESIRRSIGESPNP
ncbi:MAG: hypothetical protein QW379_09590 [Thermoplasmata archaeon]